MKYTVFVAVFLVMVYEMEAFRSREQQEVNPRDYMQEKFPNFNQ